MPVLVVSGYAVQLIARLKVLDPAAVFIQKPCRLREIVAAVRQLLITI